MDDCLGIDDDMDVDEDDAISRIERDDDMVYLLADDILRGAIYIFPRPRAISSLSPPFLFRTVARVPIVSTWKHTRGEDALTPFTLTYNLQ